MDRFISKSMQLYQMILLQRYRSQSPWETYSENDCMTTDPMNMTDPSRERC